MDESVSVRAAQTNRTPSWSLCPLNLICEVSRSDPVEEQQQHSARHNERGHGMPALLPPRRRVDQLILTLVDVLPAPHGLAVDRRHVPGLLGDEVREAREQLGDLGHARLDPVDGVEVGVLVGGEERGRLALEAVGAVGFVVLVLFLEPDRRRRRRRLSVPVEGTLLWGRGLQLDVIRSRIRQVHQAQYGRRRVHRLDQRLLHLFKRRLVPPAAVHREVVPLLLLPLRPVPVGVVRPRLPRSGGRRTPPPVLPGRAGGDEEAERAQRIPHRAARNLPRRRAGRDPPGLQPGHSLDDLDLEPADEARGDPGPVRRGTGLGRAARRVRWDRPAELLDLGRHGRRGGLEEGPVGSRHGGLPAVRGAAVGIVEADAEDVGRAPVRGGGSPDHIRDPVDRRRQGEGRVHPPVAARPLEGVVVVQVLGEVDRHAPRGRAARGRRGGRSPRPAAAAPGVVAAEALPLRIAPHEDIQGDRHELVRAV
mmetsp:Transcript_26920/g.63876  ORF Transcript_26920/g.63876 Transcript_26920/m.63876 type:complete len:479 (+) Transcript_26920:123-1559(+)